MKKLLLSLLAVFAFSNIVFGATTYYVATNGSDSNTGTSTSPFLTISYAYTLAGPGDSIIVKPGTYTDYTPWVGLDLINSGTPGNPIVLKSQIKWQAIIDGGNISDHISGIRIHGDYHVIDGFEITNGFEEGVYIAGTALNNIIKNNHIHHNGNIGDPNSANGQDGVLSEEYTSGTIYDANSIHHNGRISLNSNLDHGMYLTGDNEIIMNNIISYNCSYGLHIVGYDTVSNMKVYNNVLAWNGRSGAVMWHDIKGVDFENNIFYSNDELGLLCYDAHGTGVVIANNIFYANVQGTTNMVWAGSNVAYTMGTNYLTSDPLFLNSANDFHLQAGSPAIDLGVTLSTVTHDFEGTARPQGVAYDIGCIEYHTGTTGIATNTNELSVNLFPNPCNGSTNLEVRGTNELKDCSYDIRITNLIGEEVFRSSSLFNRNLKLDISHLPAGSYFLKLYSESGAITRKIIIEK